MSRVLWPLLLAICFLTLGVSANESTLLFMETFEHIESATGRPAGWTRFTGTGGAVSAVKVRSGSQSWVMDDPATDVAMGLRSPKVAAEAGKSYTVGGWAFIESGLATVYIEFWDESGKRSSTEWIRSSQLGEWHWVSITKVAPPGTKQVSVMLYSSMPTITRHYYDDVSIWDESAAAEPVYEEQAVAEPDTPELLWVEPVLEAQMPVGSTQTFTSPTGTCAIKPATFDTLNSILIAGAAYKNADNRNGTLAWGNSYVMEAYTVMYEATRDTVYLDILIDQADAALANRDSERGWVDYRGRSQRGWQAAGLFSIGQITLLDQHGAASLYLQVATAGNNDDTHVSIKPSANSPDYFDLRIWNSTNNYDTTFKALTMNPQDERYAPRILEASHLADPWGVARLQVADHVTQWTSPQQNPVATEKSFYAPPYLWPVHQGRIVFPMITLARFVYEDPFLSSNPYYKEKADTYIQATRDVLELLEPEWRENEAGEGWYIVEKGAPVWMDGIDEPHNHYIAVARAIIQLAAITGEEKWTSRAEKITRTFFNDLRETDNGSYIFSSWWSKGYGANGWAVEDDISTNTLSLRKRPTIISDVSHAVMPVEFAFLAYQAGIHFTDAQMQRLALMVTQNIFTTRPDGSPTMTNRIDGTGPNSKWSDSLSGRFSVINDWAPEVYPIACEMMQNWGLKPGAVDMLSMARMVWTQARSEMDLAEHQYAARDIWLALPRVRFVSPVKKTFAPLAVQGQLPLAIDAYVSPGRTLVSVNVRVDDEMIYQGHAVPKPGELVLDSSTLADGEYTLAVEIVDSVGHSATQELVIVVQNRWSKTDVLKPPAKTAFGVIDLTLIYEQSAGWVHTADSSQLPLGDKNRMYYTGEGPGYLIWRTPEDSHSYELDQFTIELFSPTALTNSYTVAVSPDNQTWTALACKTQVSMASAGGYQIQLTGQLPVGAKMQYLKLTVEPGLGDAVQLESVTYGGTWRRR